MLQRVVVESTTWPLSFDRLSCGSRSEFLDPPSECIPRSDIDRTAAALISPAATLIFIFFDGLSSAKRAGEEQIGEI